MRPVVGFHLSSEPLAATIDPALLVHNHFYLFHMITRLGFPRSSALDLGVTTYPYANSQSYSTLFKVGN